MKTSTIIGIILLILIILGAFALLRNPDDGVNNNGNGDNSALEGSDQLGNPLQAGTTTDDDVLDGEDEPQVQGASIDDYSAEGK